MNKDKKIISLAEKFGTPFYLLNTEKFKETFERVVRIFRDHYENFNIAYSFKTNYIPRVCSLVKKLNGKAEIVSSMEGKLALKTGFRYDEIIFNGPYKDDFAFELLKNGGTVIIDNIEETEKIIEFAKLNSKTKVNIGLRLNFNIGKEKISRFGFDVQKKSFEKIVEELTGVKNISLNGFHCHIGGARGLEFWKSRATEMLRQIRKFNLKLEFIDLGSGMFGEMEESLSKQFANEIPSFETYAKETLTPFNNEFKSLKYKPLILCEFGTTIVANAMSFLGEVTAVKSIRDKNFAVLNCSSHNLGVLSTKKNLPITIIGEGSQIKDVDFVGYTCIEDDCFYHNYNGSLAKGNLVLFENVGSYSVGMKPPFILPNVKIIETDNNYNYIKIVKRDETFEDVFQTFVFD